MGRFQEQSAYCVPFDSQVWYNRQICAQVCAYLDSLPHEVFTLIGFSKSALGAWNVTRMFGPRILKTVLFDAPVARQQLPPWQTEAFYPDDAHWQSDLPLNTIDDFIKARAPNHQLTLISGELFHPEMLILHQALLAKQANHTWHPTHHFKHHWNSGWLQLV